MKKRSVFSFFSGEFENNSIGYFGLMPVFLTVLICIGSCQIQAVDIPFTSEHLVEGDFDDVRSVYSADIDGDGDLDILGAAYLEDDITWWENTDGSGTSWTDHLVEGDFDGAYSVYSADIDGDGDMDVLGAAYDAR